jgi:hypothetical protein
MQSATFRGHQPVTSEAAFTIPGVHLARIHCSDCPEEVEVLVDELDELDGLVCECGYGFVLESVEEAELVSVTPAIVVRLRGEELPLAA